jgi:hypothetical protein
VRGKSIFLYSILKKEKEIMKVLKIEEHPLPKSDKAIKFLAYLRGATSGYDAAEGLMFLERGVIT